MKNNELIGSYLKKIRLSKNIKISEVAKNLNISSNFLLKIEEDNFSNYLEKAFLTGHVRAYAQFLNLDGNEIVRKLKTQTLFIYDDVLDELPKPLGKKHFSFLPKSVAIFSILIIASGFYLHFVKSNDFQNNYSITSDIPESYLYEIESVNMKMSLIKEQKKLSDYLQQQSIINLEESVIQDNSNILDQKEVNEKQSIAIASLPSENENDDLDNNITLKFLGSTWIQLRDDKNEIIISKLMNINDEYSYNINKQYLLTTGNAGNIIILINGETRGKLGRKGEVKESAIINSAFNN